MSHKLNKFIVLLLFFIIGCSSNNVDNFYHKKLPNYPGNKQGIKKMFSELSGSSKQMKNVLEKFDLLYREALNGNIFAIDRFIVFSRYSDGAATEFMSGYLTGIIDKYPKKVFELCKKRKMFSPFIIYDIYDEDVEKLKIFLEKESAIDQDAKILLNIIEQQQCEN